MKYRECLETTKSSCDGLININILSEIIKYIIANILGFWDKIDKKFIYDLKLIHPQTLKSRSMEITVSISRFPPEKWLYLIIIVNDTTERDQIATLESENDFKNDLLESVSHELRTPLNSTINLIDAAISSNSIDEITKRDLLIPALKCGEILKWVLDDVLDLALITSKKFALNITHRDIVKSMQQCISLMEMKANQKNIKVAVMIPDHNFFFSTDHSRFKQILINLFSNAIKFTQEGKITFEAVINKNDLLICIEDEGIGMDEAARKKLRKTLNNNQYFQKVDDHSSGACIGMFIINHHTKNLGSGVKFWSQPGKGTKFWFTIENNFKRNNSVPHFKNNLDGKNKSKPIIFPRKYKTYNKIELEIKENNHSSFEDLDCSEFQGLEGNLNDKGPSSKMIKYSKTVILENNHNISFEKKNSIDSPIVNIPCKCPKILIVDDDPFNAYSLSKILESLKFSFCIAVNGRKAMEAVKERENKCKLCENFDLILMDINMPVMNGLEATNAIRNDLNNHKIPIVGCTAYLKDSIFEECLESGMNDCINKPLSRDKIQEIINKFT